MNNLHQIEAGSHKIGKPNNLKAFGRKKTF